jgi:hypothetical protein
MAKSGPAHYARHVAACGKPAPVKESDQSEEKNCPKCNKSFKMAFPGPANYARHISLCAVKPTEGREGMEPQKENMPTECEGEEKECPACQKKYKIGGRGRGGFFYTEHLRNCGKLTQEEMDTSELHEKGKDENGEEVTNNRISPQAPATKQCPNCNKEYKMTGRGPAFYASHVASCNSDVTSKPPGPLSVDNNPQEATIENPDESRDKNEVRKCPSCDKTYPWFHLTYYNRHVAACGKFEPETVPREPEEKKCPACNKSYTMWGGGMTYYVRHVATCAISEEGGQSLEKQVESETQLANSGPAVTTLKCCVLSCPKSFPTRNQLKRHLAAEHYRAKLAEAYPGLTCIVSPCRHVATTNDKLAEHISQQHEKVLQFILMKDGLLLPPVEANVQKTPKEKEDMADQESLETNNSHEKQTYKENQQDKANHPGKDVEKDVTHFKLGISLSVHRSGNLETPSLSEQTKEIPASDAELEKGPEKMETADAKTNETEDVEMQTENIILHQVWDEEMQKDKSKPSILCETEKGKEENLKELENISSDSASEDEGEYGETMINQEDKGKAKRAESGLSEPEDAIEKAKEESITSEPMSHEASTEISLFEEMAVGQGNQEREHHGCPEAGDSVWRDCPACRLPFFTTELAAHSAACQGVVLQQKQKMEHHEEEGIKDRTYFQASHSSGGRSGSSIGGNGAPKQDVRAVFDSDSDSDSD